MSMNAGTMIVAGAGIGLAGYGLYLATRPPPPTTSERLINAFVSPVEAASGGLGTALTIAPWLPVMILVGIVGLIALVILVLPSGAIGGIATKRLGG